MHILTVAFVALLFLVFDYGVSAQQTITGTIGTTVRISCDTTVKNTSIFWRHQRTLSARDQYVCIRSKVVPAYAERFSLVPVSTGYILTIRSVNVNDSGTYICIEEDGLGLRHYTTLVVRGPHSLSSIIAKPGDSAVLPCHGTFVQWVYQKDQNSAEVRIFDENGVQEEFKTKFLVTHSSGPSDYSLTVNNAADADSGNYTCIDTAGVESRHTVHLKVSVPATTTAPPEISSRDTTLIVSVAVATTAVVVAVGALIPLCYFVIGPWLRRKRMKKHEKKNDRKQWHDECIRLLLCHSLESNVLQVKFNYLRTELATLDLSDVISNLMKERILTAQESNVLKKNSDHRNQSEQLLKRLDASSDKEPYVKLRQAMLLHKRFLKFVTCIDELVVDQDTSLINELHSKKSHKKHSVLKGPTIVGITSMGKRLYVLRIKGTQDVEVYDSTSFKLINDGITVPDLSDPADLTSCKNLECLFVSDKGAKCIYRVDLINDESVGEQKWNVEDTPRGLSVTSKNNLLVCYVVVSKIKEYTADGIFVRVINLYRGPELLHKRPNPPQPMPAHTLESIDETSQDVVTLKSISMASEVAGNPAKILENNELDVDQKVSNDSAAVVDLKASSVDQKVGDDSAAVVDLKVSSGEYLSFSNSLPKPNEVPTIAPWHAIELSDDRFVICHTENSLSSGPTMHRVCIIDANGKVINSYGGLQGSAPLGQLNGPGHLAVDTDKFVYVADTYNYRVLLLTPTLKFAREIMSPMQLRYPVPSDCSPNRLFLDAQSRQLLVADNNKIFVVNV